MERVQETAGRRNVTGGFSAGAKKSLPVIIGMIPSAMAFGILAKTAGLSIWESLFMSAVVFAGASQFAALNMLMIGVSMADILITTALLNARHIMMGSSISQRMERGINPFEKFALFFFLTDESFSIASLQGAEIVTPGFLWGVQLPIFLTWNVLTLCGYIGTAFLPRDLQSSMGIAIYALFLAIIIPAARKSRAAFIVTLSAMTLSALLKWLPIFAQLNRGLAIIISAGAAAVIGALLFPTGKEERG
ncbi:AzlC family ABC transporter permease [uncultured Cloacibacillus sp.]|uniref:AzlC family ABC transporter permease n=1 Tax=uncultured Cloacibacillus sp. TaxID=889794 RepID=UPI0027D956BF|nr:AzlC family ABC transporter permease [uncultured Cloacibacillus sp.]